MIIASELSAACLVAAYAQTLFEASMETYTLTVVKRGRDLFGHEGISDERDDLAQPESGRIS